MVTLEEITVIGAPIERCFDLARSVEVHLFGNVHWGESAVATAGVTSGLVGLGQRVNWRAKHFGVWHELLSEITSMYRPIYFQDRMLHGPFRFMEHDHFFRVLSRAIPTEMKDAFRFAAPLPILGRMAEIAVLRQYMQRLLRERNHAIKQIAESDEWRRYLRVMKIVIPGGSGQVGRVLARHFHSQGHAVTVLSRQPRPGSVACRRLGRPYARRVDYGSRRKATCVSTLPEGASIAGTMPPTERVIYESRIQSTRLLGQVLGSLKPAPESVDQRQYRDHLPPCPRPPHERNRWRTGR